MQNLLNFHENLCKIISKIDHEMTKVLRKLMLLPLLPVCSPSSSKKSWLGISRWFQEKLNFSFWWLSEEKLPLQFSSKMISVIFKFKNYAWKFSCYDESLSLMILMYVLIILFICFWIFLQFKILKDWNYFSLFNC